MAEFFRVMMIDPDSERRLNPTRVFLGRDGAWGRILFS